MTRIADYQTLESLGNGSHGQVHKAMPPERLGLGTEPVALKVYDRSTDAAEYGRVVEEVKVYAAAARGVDQLAPLYDVGRHGERLFMAMAFYPEGSLAARARGLTKQQVVELVADAARGAHALHEAGLVHREIKPANVFLSAGGRRGVLADLGLAHVVSPGQTVTGLGVSSLETMEPGLVRGETSARASDIWSLGATLHWALTGQGVFADLPDSSLIAVLRHIMTATPAIVGDGIPEPVREVLERCLAPDRMERYGTALALADDLDRIVEGISA